MHFAQIKVGTENETSGIDTTVLFFGCFCCITKYNIPFESHYLEIGYDGKYEFKDITNSYKKVELYMKGYRKNWYKGKYEVKMMILNHDGKYKTDGKIEVIQF